MRKTIIGMVGMAAVIAVAGCSQRSANSADGGFTLTSPASPSLAASAGGGTVKESLTGVAIGGVVPQGEALADESQYLSGGSTTLTVQIKNVNLPDGTVLPVSLDFTPIGSVTLSKREGTLRTSLGHFAVSRDQIRITNNGATILSGGAFF